ncbi:MAG: 50S ribosomal protein L11 methyltransferase, partial [Burkholderiales bacterium]|nr:50S ribosomal protein L11 methyltransferase [Burkholderiales bacterium]
KLGGKNVSGVDIDKQAIESSKYNANNNMVNVNWYLPQQLPNTQFDIVIANILSNPLRMLAQVLSNHTRQSLVLSGILESQINELSAIYLKYFTIVTAIDIMDGWVLLKCEHKHELS